ncbi:hypothetical protein ABZP36_011757 [Zizania latifolia]
MMLAPMVDNLELPFCMLCWHYGANAAYTPMLHSRIFSKNDKYRSMEFTTCKGAPTRDLRAKIVEPYRDYVDINFQQC